MTRTITMSLDEYDKQRDANRELGKQLEQAEKQLRDEKLAQPKVAELTSIIKAALEVVGFATANLSPEIVKRWPYQALVVIANNLHHVPGASAHEVEFARELHKIAVECEVWERKRTETFEQYVPPPPPNGPQSLGYGYVPKNTQIPTLPELPGSDLTPSET